MKPDPFAEFMDKRCIEPQKRLRGGSFGWASHRFPIKGGVSFRETLARDLCKSNPFMADVFAKHGQPLPIGTRLKIRMPGDFVVNGDGSE